MMKPEQVEVLHGLGDLLDWAPGFRVGQLVANLGFLSEAAGGRGLGDIEDEELLEVIRRHREELADVSEAARNA